MCVNKHVPSLLSRELVMGTGNAVPGIKRDGILKRFLNCHRIFTFIIFNCPPAPLQPSTKTKELQVFFLTLLNGMGD